MSVSLLYDVCPETTVGVLKRCGRRTGRVEREHSVAENGLRRTTMCGGEFGDSDVR